MEEAFTMAELYIKGIKSSIKAQISQSDEFPNSHQQAEAANPTLTYLKGLEETLKKMKNIYTPPSSSGWGTKKDKPVGKSGWEIVDGKFIKKDVPKELEK